MDFSEFTIRIIIILIPGAVATLLIEALTIHKKWAPPRFIISSIILGALSLCTLQLFYWASQLFHVCRDNFSFECLETWKCIFKKEISLNPLEIILCLPCAIILGLSLSAIIQKKIIYTIAKRLDVSHKFGDDSLYYNYLNTKEVDWVYVRDKANGLTYRGQVESFSEDESNKELLLRNVTVYHYDTCDELYAMSQIYLKFHERDVIIELPLITENIT